MLVVCLVCRRFSGLHPSLATGGGIVGEYNLGMGRLGILGRRLCLLASQFWDSTCIAKAFLELLVVN